MGMSVIFRPTSRERKCPACQGGASLGYMRVLGKDASPVSQPLINDCRAANLNAGCPLESGPTVGL
jgi:hypothetical protein